MLALILASIVCVQPGASADLNIDVGFVMRDPGTFRADNLNIAVAAGGIAVGSSRGTLTAYGVEEGETVVRMIYYRTFSGGRPFPEVARIIVGQPMAVALSASATVVAEDSPVTLTLTTSEKPAGIAWYEGDRYLGMGPVLTLKLSKGVHRIRAEVWNHCGTITREVEITVAEPRRRAARH